MSHDPAVLAVDIGTSSARALLFDAQGHAIDGATAAHALTWEEVDGGFQAEPDALLQIVLDVIDEIVRHRAFRGREIAGVALTSFWHSLMGLDGEGRPATPLYPWMDGRSRGVMPRLRQRLGDSSTSRTGAPLHSTYWPARLLWLRETQPHLSRRVRRWLSFGEYLLVRLFGDAPCHVSMASGTGLLDLRRRRWDLEILEATGLEERVLPEVGGTDRPSRGLTKPFAGRWRALADAPWFGPFGDGACSNVGVGSLDRDRVTVTVGTSGAMRMAWAGEEVDIPRGLWCYRIDDQRFVLGGALSNGGNLHDWLHRELAISADEAQVADELAALPPDGHGLTMLPFWAGERSPDYPEDARGVLLDVSFQTTPVDIMRASLEALSFRFASLYALLRPQLAGDHRILATGGALVRSPVWAQILADVLNHPVETVDVREGTARGAALLALEALGLVPSAAMEPPEAAGRYEPGAAAAVYAQAAARHNHLYRAALRGNP